MCLGVPGRIIDTYHEHDVLMGKVDFGGVLKRICIEHVPDVQQGDYVVVHAGFALSIVDEQEAKQVFKFLEAMGDLDDIAQADVAREDVE